MVILTFQRCFTYVKGPKGVKIAMPLCECVSMII